MFEFLDRRNNHTKKPVKESIVTWTAAITSSYVASDFARGLDTKLGQIFDTGATIYSKAMDQKFLDTHIGGGDHRLFDGGHDLLGAWQNVKAATTTDNFATEVTAYVSELWKDMVTPNGLPVITWNPETFQAFSGVLQSIPGVTASGVKDLVSFTSTELLATVVGVGALLLHLKNEDHEQYTKLCGMLGVSAVVSANPFLIAVVITATLKSAAQAKKSNRIIATLQNYSVGITIGAVLLLVIAFVSLVGMSLIPPLLLLGAFGLGYKLYKKRKISIFIQNSLSLLSKEMHLSRALPPPPNNKMEVQSKNL